MSCADESDEHWSYDNPSTWPDHFPAAGGSCQSPINVVSSETVPQQYPPFVFSPDYMGLTLLTLTNNGHQVAATLKKDAESKTQPDLWITGGGLMDTFHFVNFHLHWGRGDRHGSEHEIDGNMFPAEAHVVHKNNKTGETAVLGFLFDITNSPDEENAQWKVYSTAASTLINIGDTVDCTINMSQLLNIEDKQFFRYIGSLTTPPCTEGVIWTIFMDNIPILEQDLNLLRTNIMRKVYRPVQPINDRVIYKNQVN
ncbi:unnamed protein product [Rotaria socialis]|uniref:Carbonic anhydrase n=1 Tax=Rotaria socialis TaxID=392032 RepID=A0A818BFS3_9BILA|nr:unnamed protein product [Rotaria socialis]CAF3746121.1 unnamed protein product [Rotaria socialis]CAF4370682.1 unnamed protein product [Rotaria socialis]CAF4633497.1 unnamed protein product [Rotaria socialis]